MSHYIEQNGLAYFWNHDNTRLELAKWVYHHPEDFIYLLELIKQQDTVMTPLTEEEIKNITGVNLNE